MIATVQAEAFAELLAKAAKLADPKSPQPALAHLLLTAEAEGLSVRASDGTASGVFRLTSGVAVKKTGAVLVPAKRLAAVAESLPPGDVELSAKATTLRLKAGERRFEMAGMSPDDYPAVLHRGDAATFDVEASTLAELLSSVRHAVSTDAGRPFLCAILVERRDGRLTAAAADGHRIAVADAADGGAPFSALIPDRVVGQIVGLASAQAGTARLSVASQWVGFATDLASITCARVEGVFPNYRALLAGIGAQPRRLLVSREALAAAAKSVSQLYKALSLGSREEAPALVLRLDADAVALRANHADAGEATDRVGAALEGETLEKIGVNASYLADALAAVPANDVAISFGGALDPLTVRPASGDGFVAIVGAVRV